MSAHDDFLDPDIHLYPGEDNAMVFNAMKDRLKRAMDLVVKFAELKVHTDQFREWKSLSEELYLLQEEIENDI